jgi:acyl carrier protein
VTADAAGTGDASVTGDPSVTGDASVTGDGGGTETVAPGRDDLLAVVGESLAVVLELDRARIQAHSVLGRDLGVDSIGRIQLADLLELRLAAAIPQLRIEDEDLRAFGTVDDVVAFLAARL